MITPELLEVIKNQLKISWNGKHGVGHWLRVFRIGMKLSPLSGADPEVVRYFSVFHDAGRLNEHQDPQHGPRGAKLAEQLRFTHLVSLSDKQFNLLSVACSLHTVAQSHENITVQTCFDSDRLDLGRVGEMPDPDLLCTEAAKTEQMISWAYTRSRRATPFPESLTELSAQFTPGFGG